ncbi:MAG: TetR/AcrR family transcriptional regulator [Candidatus Omnitrophota bacterium]
MGKILNQKMDTRTKMMQVAFDLFHQQGVNATSVDQILEKSGTGKSQFSHYFKNKEGLVHACLQSFLSLLQSGQAPVKPDLETWKDLERWFNFFIGAQESTGCQRGCPIATIANELTTNDELIRQDVKMLFDHIKGGISTFFHKMKAKGELKQDVDPDALADYCLSVMQGGMVLSKVNRHTKAFENSVRHAILYIHTLRV